MILCEGNRKVAQRIYQTRGRLVSDIRSRDASCGSRISISVSSESVAKGAGDSVARIVKAFFRALSEARDSADTNGDNQGQHHGVFNGGCGIVFFEKGSDGMVHSYIFDMEVHEVLFKGNPTY